MSLRNRYDNPIEAGITSHYSLQIVEIEELRNYGLLPNELGLIYKCSTEIIPYVMIWDGISKCSYDKGENGVKFFTRYLLKSSVNNFF
ncbi:hypothetical protein CWI36_2071p0010 [Hamiltosporidium magnivora]|uniref:Uncharacterized protein n=1 Tax=Hamiltosporidium magnivora TaxID=148818 RepID=A0A4Q9KY72_9MICR|nr:hypothetical protein CWI36_2071p0010 [Hamiltosporidium magnivora]